MKKTLAADPEVSAVEDKRAPGRGRINTPGHMYPARAGQGFPVEWRGPPTPLPPPSVLFHQQMLFEHRPKHPMLETYCGAYMDGNNGYQWSSASSSFSTSSQYNRQSSPVKEKPVITQSEAEKRRANADDTANHWDDRQSEYREYREISAPKSEAEIRSMISQFRVFKPTKYGLWYEQFKHQNQPKQCTEFTLMTYNLLSQDLLENHDSLYFHCRGTNSLNWPKRGQLIQRELKETNADIVCLQEVHCEHYKDMYLPFMRDLGYEGVYKKRTGDKWDGCAIFYRSDKFTLEKSVEVEFHRMDMTKLLNRDNVALIGVFKPKNGNDGDKVIVATTHLVFNPKRGDIKVAQLRLLLAEIDKVARKGGNKPVSADISGAEVEYHPVLLCGDMNTEPYSPIYRFIRDGKLDCDGLRSGDLSGQGEGRDRGYQFTDRDLNMYGINSSTRFKDTRNEFTPDTSSVSHDFKFNTVYPLEDQDGNAFVSTDHQKASCLVDYVFYSKCDSCKLLGYNKLLTTDQMNHIGSLPNAFLGSDHLSLVARFLLKPPDL